MKLNAKRQAHGQSSLMTSANASVSEMIDEMVVIEGKDQAADDKKQPWCNGEFDKSDREENDEKVEIQHFEAEIAGLDKAVVEATEQRKEDHEQYVEEHQLSST